MTTVEFKKEHLSKAKSLKALIELRNETRASKFVMLIKEKIEKILIKRGFEQVTISASSLNKYMNPHTNAFARFTMKNSRKLSYHNEKRVQVYVNHRHGSKFTMCDIFIK